jgi:hypothetical protein
MQEGFIIGNCPIGTKTVVYDGKTLHEWRVVSNNLAVQSPIHFWDSSIDDEHKISMPVSRKKNVRYVDNYGLIFTATHPRAQNKDLMYCLIDLMVELNKKYQEETE